MEVACVTALSGDRMRPFREGDTYATFQNVVNTTVREIEALDNDYVLKASQAELEEYYVAKVIIEPLCLDTANHYIEREEGTQIGITDSFSRIRYAGEGAVSVKGTTIHIAIPYTGDKILWRVRPSTFSLSGYPELDIRDAAVVFSCTFRDDAANAQQLKAEIAGTISALSEAVANIHRDVDSHNRSAPATLKAALARKLDKARSATGAIAALGIPMKKRGHPLTYTVPTKRRASPISRPRVATEKYEAEPALDPAEFEYIIGVLKSMSLVIERNPAAFATLDEEAIRMHFLLQLNGHYEGAATGETFNAVGKTDILIRVNNRNIFVAECKFWRGVKSFDDAIDQVLSYLSWRDSKCALLVFNRTKDSSAVRQKMHEAMIARPEFRKVSAQDSQGDSRYVFVKTDDPGREIHISTLLFDIPNPANADT